MKKEILILFLFIALIFIGCSEKTGNTHDKTPPPMANNFDLQFIIPDTLTEFISETINYNDEEVTAYSLINFIPQDSVNIYTNQNDFDARILFAIEAVSSDEDGNFSPRKKGYPDLPWNQFKTGYYLPDVSKRLYFPDENIFGVYDVKNAHYLKLYRKVDVVSSDKTVIFETNAFETKLITYFINDEEFNDYGYTIKNFISNYVTETPENYNYQFITANNSINDDSENIFSWETLQNSYWLTEKNKAIFLDDAMHFMYDSIDFLKEIKLIPKNE